MRLQRADGGRPDARQDQPDRDPAGAPGGHVQQDDEDGEEEERGAQIALQDQHRDADQPDRDDRSQHPAGGEPQPPHPASRVGQRAAVGGKIGREEDGDQNLGELARLNGKSGDTDPDLRPVDGREKNRRRHQQQRERRTDIGVPLQHAVVAQQHHHRDEEPDADRRPHQLGGRGMVGRGLQIESEDQHQPEPVEQHGGGQQQRIGVRGAKADGEMREQRECAEPGAVPDRTARQRMPSGQPHDHISADADQDRAYEEGQFDAPSLGQQRQGWGVSAGRAAAALAIAVMPGNVASGDRYFRYAGCDVRGVRVRRAAAQGCDRPEE